MLDAVTGCEITHSSNPTLLLFAGGIAAGGLWWGMDGGDRGTIVLWAVLISIALVVAYFATRQQVLRISSSSTHIDLNLSGSSLDEIVAIIDAIETARDARRNSAPHFDIL